MKIWYLRLLALTSFAITTTTTTANAIPSTHNGMLLLPRDTTCPAGAKDQQSCGSNLPFCCPSGAVCVPTTSDNSAVICCPTASSCDFIQPIVCDISQQDASKFPNNLLHTTNLTAKLATCGSACCPLGYECQNGMCGLTKALASPSSSSSSSSTTPTSTSSAPAASSPSSTSAPASSPTLSSGAIAGIVLGVISGIALIAITILLILHQRRKNKNIARNSADFMGKTPPQSPQKASHSAQPSYDQSVAAGISNPIVIADNHRTDFLLRRGSGQTGYEQRLKPKWSTAGNRSGLARQQTSNHILTSSSAAVSACEIPDFQPRGSPSPTPRAGMNTEMSQLQRSDSTSRGAGALGIGLPSNPSPRKSPNSRSQSRPGRRSRPSEDSIPQISIARSLTLNGLRKKASETNIKASARTPTTQNYGDPSSKWRAVRGRSGSQAQLLAENERERSQTGAFDPNRQSTSSFDTSSTRSSMRLSNHGMPDHAAATHASERQHQTSGLNRNASKSSEASTGTINVMLPEPYHQFSTPDLHAQHQYLYQTPNMSTPHPEYTPQTTLYTPQTHPTQPKPTQSKQTKQTHLPKIPPIPPTPTDDLESEGDMRRATTFDDLMTKAGWKGDRWRNRV